MKTIQVCCEVQMRINTLQIIMYFEINGYYADVTIIIGYH